MANEQTSISDLFGEVRDANEINLKILELIDSVPVPKNKDAVSTLGEKIANLISKELYERLNLDQKIGINLEFIGDKPRFEIYKISDSCGCGA